MRTYNGIIIPESIKTNRIISAFQNEIDSWKLKEYIDILREEMLSNEFPPILGYPIIITEDDFRYEFLNSEEINRNHVGQMAWKVTDGHHRSLAAIEVGLPYLLTELDYNCITNENEL